MDNNAFANEQVMNDLSRLSELFFQSTGIGVSLADDSGRTIVRTGWQMICTHFHEKHPQAKRGCKESEQFFSKHINDAEFVEHKCSNGLYELGIALNPDGAHRANIYFGQVLYTDEPVEKQFFIQQANRFGFDVDQYLQTLKQVPVMPRNKVIAHAYFFTEVVRTILQYNR
jgi:ligand-binding sensor protein